MAENTLLEDVDTLFLPIPGKPTATSMGNPHCSFFVDNLDEVKIEAEGAEIENHPFCLLYTSPSPRDA